MPSLDQLKLLINLARIDGEVAEKEKNYILNIGQANHMMVAEILPLFSNIFPTVASENLSNSEKFDYIFSLVQLMKIDDKLYREEIRYCAKVASVLGYRQEVLFELMLNVKNTPVEQDEMDALKKMTAGYLKGK